MRFDRRDLEAQRRPGWVYRAVCGFISSAVYEGRLGSDDASGTQALVSMTGADLVGAGMRAVPHLGRSQVSPEEIEAIVAHIASLSGATYRDRDCRSA